MDTIPDYFKTHCTRWTDFGYIAIAYLYSFYITFRAVLANGIQTILQPNWAIPVNRGTPPRRSKLINLKGQKHGFLEG